MAGEVSATTAAVAAGRHAAATDDEADDEPPPVAARRAAAAAVGCCGMVAADIDVPTSVLVEYVRRGRFRAGNMYAAAFGSYPTDD